MHVIFHPELEAFPIGIKPNPNDCPENTYIYLHNGNWFVTTMSDLNPKRLTWIAVPKELVPKELQIKALLLK